MALNEQEFREEKSSFRKCLVAMEFLLSLIALYLIVFGISGCTVQTQTRKLTSPMSFDSLDHESEYLKAHMQNGNVYILSGWSVTSGEKNVTGDGVLLGPNRDTLAQGKFSLSIDSIAIIETNVIGYSWGLAALGVMTVASATLSIYCITHHKACFGSCPTFYARAGSEDVLLAEGFSSSILPSLEATDLTPSIGLNR